MDISVFGLGYVGTVCAACFADRGHNVIGIDKAASKVELIRSGQSPIIERDIDDIVKRNVACGRLTATFDVDEAVAHSELSMICVGTPSQPNGSASLAAVETVATEIGEAIKKKPDGHVIVVRSTIAPGTTRQTVLPRLQQASGRNSLEVAFNPEFMRESSAVADFNSPSKTVVGALEHETAERVMNLYADLGGPKITTELETAELVKYVDNSWHALKVAFGNEIGVVAKALGINSHEVMQIFMQDTRLNISPAYLRPGFAFGGSCLPKDLRALTHLARNLDLSLPVLNHIMDSNRMVIDRGAEWILSLGKRRVGFLGISFKSGTDDVRESPFVDLVERLLGKGYGVKIFDPNVRLAHLIGANRDYLMRVVPHIADLMVEDVREVLDWSETLVVTGRDPAYASAVMEARRDQTVLDFCGLNLGQESQAQPHGFLW
jgi:GDP-mannose 6-dehydrogenase